MKDIRYKFKTKVGRKLITFWFLGVFVVIYIFLSLQTVTSGSKLAELEKELGLLKSQNKELNLKLVESTSLTNMNQGAESYGFKKPEKTVYLSIPESVAKLP